MKVIALMSVACIALAATSAAQAAPALSSFEADTTVSLYQDHAINGTLYDSCQGRTTGTAAAACGSLTGGPSGSLF